MGQGPSKYSRGKEKFVPVAPHLCVIETQMAEDHNWEPHNPTRILLSAQTHVESEACRDAKHEVRFHWRFPCQIPQKLALIALEWGHSAELLTDSSSHRAPGKGCTPWQDSTTGLDVLTCSVQLQSYWRHLVWLLQRFCAMSLLNTFVFGQSTLQVANIQMQVCGVEKQSSVLPSVLHIVHLFCMSATTGPKMWRALQFNLFLLLGSIWSIRLHKDTGGNGNVQSI